MSADALRVWMISGSPALPAGADVGAKALALPLHVGEAALADAVVVEAGLADRHHLRQRRQLAAGRRASARGHLRCPDARRRSPTGCRAPAPSACTCSNSSSVVQMHSARSTAASAIATRIAGHCACSSGKVRWQCESKNMRVLEWQERRDVRQRYRAPLAAGSGGSVRSSGSACSTRSRCRGSPRSGSSARAPFRRSGSARRRPGCARRRHWPA